MSTASSERVETLMGSIPLSEIGITLPHEHLASNFIRRYVAPPSHLEMNPDEDFFLRNIAVYNQYPYSNKNNLCLFDPDVVCNFYHEINLFKQSGGKTILDNSSCGLKPDLTSLLRICRVTKINVLIGTGYSTACMQLEKTGVLEKTKEEMYQVMRKDLEEEYDWTKECDLPIALPINFTSKAAFIGEVGSSWPINDFEKRSISATGEVQAQLRCPVSFNPAMNESAAMETLRIYQEAGGNSKKAIISHVDSAFCNYTKFLEFLDDTDCYVQFALFGSETSIYYNTEFDILSDAQRIRRIEEMKENKKLNRVLMSHDIHTKNRLVSFGGHGYAYIQKNIVPHMLAKGFTTEDIEELTIQNPKRWLSQSE